MNPPKIILVVEDEHSLLLVLRDRLEDEGYRILQAGNGEEGLNLAFKHHPDLILLDLLMPVMDGITMLQKLREDAWGKEVKVMVITNLSKDEKLHEVEKYGVRNYLLKTDWKIEEVIDKIEAKLNES